VTIDFQTLRGALFVLCSQQLIGYIQPLSDNRMISSVPDFTEVVPLDPSAPVID
jgi:hypothetical protein